MLFYAVVGGFLLNLLPCSLPVLGLKLSALMHRNNAIAHLLGSMLVFACFGIAMGVFNVAFAAHWGNREFQVLVAIFMAVSGAGMAGLWHMPPLSAAVDNTNHFITGAVITAIGVSCSGPFLGPALAATIGASPELTLVTMLCVGLGFNLPLVLNFWLPVSKIRPPVGVSEWFTTAAGYFALASSAYLVSLCEQVLIFPTLLAIISLVYSMSKKLHYLWHPQLTICALILVFAVASTSKDTSTPDDTEFLKFDETRLTRLMQSGPVVVIATSDFCLTCETYKSQVLDTDQFEELVKLSKGTVMVGNLDNERFRKFARKQSVNTAPSVTIFFPDKYPKSFSGWCSVSQFRKELTPYIATEFVPHPLFDNVPN